MEKEIIFLGVETLDLTYFEGHVVVSWVIFSFSHVFNNVTLDFNSFTVIAVFI
jgi:hypothetical protein